MKKNSSTLVISELPESLAEDATTTSPPLNGKPSLSVPRNNRLMPKHAGIGPERISRARQEDVKPVRQTSSLGSLEAEILGLLWEIGRPASGMDVMEVSLYKRRRAGQEPISFASIATTLRRLSDKGLLQMEKGEQRTPMYTPTVERELMAARILNNVSVTLLGRTLQSLLPQLQGLVKASSKSASAEEQKQVARLMLAFEEIKNEGGVEASEDEAM